MVYVIENTSNAQVGPVLASLKSIVRPDGGSTSNAKVDEQLHDEGGEVYFIREVEEVSVGNGPRRLNTAFPSWSHNGGWQKITKFGPALPDPADAQGGNSNAPGFDPDYAENFGKYREEAYSKEGINPSSMSSALWESMVNNDHTDKIALEAKREEVKLRFPAPVV